VVAAARSVSGAALRLAAAGGCVRELIEAVVAQRQYLSEIDGLIGDGDHGVNMAKGFGRCAERLDAMGSDAEALPAALSQLAEALRDDIGGSMGPLYGAFFDGLADTLAPHPWMDAALFGEALAAAALAVERTGDAQPGDKTLVDALIPALEAYREALRGGSDFAAALAVMSGAAATGRDATKHMQARLGRAARLGARSIGVLDAGATSCCLILQTMAASLSARLSSAQQRG
jgi:dihydroxyacetone kinase